MSQIEILLIDDDDAYFAFVKHVINKYFQNIKLLNARNGQEALDILKDRVKNSVELPDIIFLDITMPVMNGFDFLMEYYKLTNDNPEFLNIKKIFIFTTSNHSLDIERAKNFGVLDYEYIVKTDDINEMKDIIKKIIETRI